MRGTAAGRRTLKPKKEQYSCQCKRSSAQSNGLLTLLSITSKLLVGSATIFLRSRTPVGKSAKICMKQTRRSWPAKWRKSYPVYKFEACYIILRSPPGVFRWTIWGVGGKQYGSHYHGKGDKNYTTDVLTLSSLSIPNLDSDAAKWITAFDDWSC